MKTAMQELAHDLQQSIEGLPETLKGINDLFIRKTVTDAVLIAYNCVLKRIDGELLEKEKRQSQEYAEFCINCHVKGLPILDFEGFINLNNDKND